MPNYSLVINSKFEPFSYSELLDPALRATQAHEKIEEEYANLDIQAGMYDKLANEALDPETHATYKKFAEDLRDQADYLAKNGLTPYSRKDLFSMKGRFAQEILPIDIAYKRRAEMQKLQDTAEMNNPHLMFERRASDISLDELVNNPAMAMPASFSGGELVKMTSNLAQKFANKLTGHKLSKEDQAMLIQIIDSYGITPEQIQDFINNPNDPKNVMFKAIRDQVIQASGIDKWKNWKDLEERVDNYIYQGLYSGIGADAVTYKEDTAEELAQKHYYQMQEMYAQAAIDQAARDDLYEKQLGLAQEQSSVNHLPVTVEPIMAANTDAEQDSEYKKKLAEWRDKNYIGMGQQKENSDRLVLYKKGTKDENINVTRTKVYNMNAMRDANSSAPLENLVIPTGEYTTTRWARELNNVAKELGMPEPVYKNKKSEKYEISTNKANAVLAIMQGKVLSGGDVYSSSQITVPISGNTAKNYWTQVGRNASKINVVQFAGENGFKTKETVPYKELVSDGYEPISINVSKHGATITLKNEEGDFKTVSNPIFNSNTHSAQMAIHNIIKYKKALESPYMPIGTVSNGVYTPREENGEFVQPNTSVNLVLYPGLKWENNPGAAQQFQNIVDDNTDLLLMQHLNNAGVYTVEPTKVTMQ